MGRILVVDDEAEVRNVLAEFLESLGHDVSEADSGPAALTHVEGNRPDAVCLDLWMDGMPGLEVLDRLTRTHPELPVVIVTADPLTDTMQDARARGAFDYVLKPFDFARLASVVSAAVARSRPPSAPR
jgi:two-component system nitrogen regulation response regulator NtrX